MPGRRITNHGLNVQYRRNDVRITHDSLTHSFESDEVFVGFAGADDFEFGACDEDFGGDAAGYLQISPTNSRQNRTAGSASSRRRFSSNINP
jgi:hypothetical protein